MAVVLGKWITPPEVVRIASEYRAAANQMRTVAQDTSKIGYELDMSWTGNAKNIFDSHYNSFPQELAFFADHLDQVATQIANIQVWVNE